MSLSKRKKRTPRSMSPYRYKPTPGHAFSFPQGTALVASVMETLSLSTADAVYCAPSSPAYAPHLGTGYGHPVCGYPLPAHGPMDHWWPPGLATAYQAAPEDGLAYVPSDHPRVMRTFSAQDVAHAQSRADAAVQAERLKAIQLAAAVALPEQPGPAAVVRYHADSPMPSVPQGSVPSMAGLCPLQPLTAAAAPHAHASHSDRPGHPMPTPSAPSHAQSSSGDDAVLPHCSDVAGLYPELTAGYQRVTRSEKRQRLLSLKPMVIDNSIRETTVAQTRGHIPECKVFCPARRRIDPLSWVTKVGCVCVCIVGGG